MTYSNKQRRRRVFLVALSFALASGCVPQTRLRYKDTLVRIREHSVVNLLNVHASKDTEILSIWGMDFPDIRGRESCYLQIPGRPLILFVTGRTYDSDQAIVHLANTSTRQITSFPAFDSAVGECIGGPQTNSFERVASLVGDTLVIEAGTREHWYRYGLNLSKPEFEYEEGHYVDWNGKTNHYVWAHGKRPQQ